ncbi:substrate-binding domain-containing protein [Puniceicoccaceae bacterium K14]|nr:substrate-binding domain-containing protein [Puniceicoccaceae bacterium K14]
MKYRIGLLITCLLLCVGLGLSLSKPGKSGERTTGASEEGKVLIGFSMDEIRGPRWHKDQSALIARAEELGAEVSIQVANSNDAKQIQDIQSLITQGVDVLVIIPHDGAAMAKGVELAAEAGIPTISYDRLITGTDKLDLYVTFDNVKVGRLQAAYLVEALKNVPNPKIVRLLGSKSDNNAFLFKKGQDEILMPLVEAGKLEIIHEDWCENWEGRNAKMIVNAAITKHGKEFHGILASADVLANGASKALEEEGLSGRILLTGQDADLVACQRIVQGTQNQTVYKPIPELAKMAAEMAYNLATAKPIVVPESIDNNMAEIPMGMADIVSVTAENMMETVVADGFHSQEEIYKVTAN